MTGQPKCYIFKVLFAFVFLICQAHVRFRFQFLELSEAAVVQWSMPPFKFETASQRSSKLYNEVFSSSVRISLARTVSTD
jgi:hypothetical protein